MYLIIFCTLCHYVSRITLHIAEKSKRSCRDCRGDLSRPISGTKVNAKKAAGTPEEKTVRKEVSVEADYARVHLLWRLEGRVFFCIDPPRQLRLSKERK